MRSLGRKCTFPEKVSAKSPRANGAEYAAAKRNLVIGFNSTIQLFLGNNKSKSKDSSKLRCVSSFWSDPKGK